MYDDPSFPGCLVLAAHIHSKTGPIMFDLHTELLFTIAIIVYFVLFWLKLIFYAIFSNIWRNFKIFLFYSLKVQNINIKVDNAKMDKSI